MRPSRAKFVSVFVIVRKQFDRLAEMCQHK
jgi:hypothetical protein